MKTPVYPPKDPRKAIQYWQWFTKHAMAADPIKARIKAAYMTEYYKDIIKGRI